MKVELLIKPGKNQQDSFWYEGEVACVSEGKRAVVIIATGEIRIYNKAGEIVYDGKERNSGFPEFPNGLESDDQLSRLRELGYYWENNNWFDFEYFLKGKNTDTMGEALDGLDGAIEYAKEAIRDNNFWEREEE